MEGEIKIQKTAAWAVSIFFFHSCVETIRDHRGLIVVLICLLAKFRLLLQLSQPWHDRGEAAPWWEISVIYASYP